MSSIEAAPWSRREFIVSSLIGAGTLAFPAIAQPKEGDAAKPAEPARTGAASDTTRAVVKPPPLRPELVKEFVGAAHGNLDRTRELLGNEPGLLNATWDWKSGDFEAAIGGAGHMGRRDIALFLIDQGARMDLFVAAMLGELDIVKAYLAAHPALVRSKGPHGITLMAHARAGGADAREVVAHLEAIQP